MVHFWIIRRRLLLRIVTTGPETMVRDNWGMSMAEVLEIEP